MPDTSQPAFMGPYESLAPPVDQHLIAVPLESQSTPNWCWAAVAASIVNYAAGRQGPLRHGQPTDQVTLAEGYGGLDHPQDLGTVLYQYKCLASQIIPPLFQKIASQIGNDNPVCARIAIGPGDAGHFVIISGCGSTPEEEIYIEDPAGKFDGWHSYAAAISATSDPIDQIYFTQ